MKRFGKFIKKLMSDAWNTVGKPLTVIIGIVFIAIAFSSVVAMVPLIQLSVTLAAFIMALVIVVMSIGVVVITIKRWICDTWNSTKIKE